MKTRTRHDAELSTTTMISSFAVPLLNLSPAPLRASPRCPRHRHLRVKALLPSLKADALPSAAVGSRVTHPTIGLACLRCAKGARRDRLKD
jgi:hypothetical protein